MPTRLAVAGLICGLVAMGAAGPAAAEPQRFTVETAKSRVGFDAFHRFGNFSASSEATTGEFDLDTADLKQPITGILTLPAESLRTGRKGRDKDIRGALDAEHHPEIRYRVEKVDSSFPSLAENNDVLLTVHGVLSVRGVERAVAFSGRMRRRPGDTLWVRGESWLKPRDFGVPLLHYWLISIKDGVLVSFDLVLNKAQ